MSIWTKALDAQIACVRDLETWVADENVRRTVVEEMGYETSYTTTLPPGNFIDAIRRGLEVGETYYWARPIIKTIIDIAPTMPDWQPEVEMLPPAGYFFFEDPIELPPIYDWTFGALTGISWVAYRRLSVDGDIVERPGWMVTFWTRMAKDGFNVPGSLATWYFDASMEAMLQSGYMVSPDEPEAAIKRDNKQLRVFAAAVQFVTQSIVEAEPRKIDRASRRRFQKLKMNAAAEHDVRVVTLRRRYQRQDHDDADREHVEWSCQWIVRGHWRQQWYPRLQRHQAKYVMPYVKGPEDKPLKGGERVFAVTR